MNFLSGSGIALTLADSPANNEAQLTITVTGAAPSGSAGGDLTGTYPNPTIAAAAVTLSKIQNAAASSKLLGSGSSGSGSSYGEVSLGTALTMVGSTLNCNGVTVATKGDLQSFGASVGNLAVGNTNGMILVVDSTQTFGMRWATMNGDATITSGGVVTLATVTVPKGGTGNTTFTAYSVICAGTTSTGAFQNVSGVGTSGQVLTSQGAGALPQWTTVTGTGTVTSVATAGWATGGTITTTGTISVLIRGYIDGLTMSTAGASTTLSIAAGECTDSTDAYMLTLAAYTKLLANTWAAGSGSNGLDTGSLTTSTWYHVHVIRKTSDGTADVLFSLSATAPTMPTGYSGFRRIGSVKSDGSSKITKFFQLEDEFTWDVQPAPDYNTTNPGTSGVSVTLAVPTGIKVFPRSMFQIALTIGGGAPGTAYVLITTTDQTDSTPGSTIHTWAVRGASTVEEISFPMPSNVYTNTSAQVRFRLDASTTSTNIEFNTSGWRDVRGKNA